MAEIVHLWGLALNVLVAQGAQADVTAGAEFELGWAKRMQRETCQMTESKTPGLPIGYWLKKADQVLTARINEAQQAHGLSRTLWQVLNVLYEVGPASAERLGESLRPFADAAALGDTLSHLSSRALVESEGSDTSGYRLTTHGRRTHEAALTLQKEVRRQAMKAISETDYLTTVRVLQQLVQNLEGEESAQSETAKECACMRS